MSFLDQVNSAQLKVIDVPRYIKDIVRQQANDCLTDGDIPGFHSYCRNILDKAIIGASLCIRGRDNFEVTREDLVLIADMMDQATKQCSGFDVCPYAAFFSEGSKIAHHYLALHTIYHTTKMESLDGMIDVAARSKDTMDAINSFKQCQLTRGLNEHYKELRRKWPEFEDNFKQCQIWAASLLALQFGVLSEITLASLAQVDWNAEKYWND